MHNGMNEIFVNQVNLTAKRNNIKRKCQIAAIFLIFK